MTNVYHYPPELLELLISAIPKLYRSKVSVLQFFEGAGVKKNVLKDLYDQVKYDKEKISKYEISRIVLVKINDMGDDALRTRREIVKRVVEFEDFTLCWPSDQAEARGLVSQVRDIVNKKDTFTRMKQELNNAKKSQREQESLEQKRRLNERSARLSTIKSDFETLVKEENPQKRGKLLEQILNDLFSFYEISIREAFIITGANNEGITEQIDGAIEIDGEIYLVEMKWWNKPLGRNDISPHIVKLYGRSDARGLYISASGYTEPAITTAREALQQRILILCELREIIAFLEQDRNIVELLKEKIRVAQLDKKPLHYVS
jgi:hypothetical protein